MMFLKLRTGRKDKPGTALVNAFQIEEIHVIEGGYTCIQLPHYTVYAHESMEEIETMLGHEKEIAVFDQFEFNRRKEIKELRKKADELRDKYVKSGSEEDLEEYRETLKDLKAAIDERWVTEWRG